MSHLHTYDQSWELLSTKRSKSGIHVVKILLDWPTLHTRANDVDESQDEEDESLTDLFEQAFNRSGETSVSDEYDDDDYYNDGTVKKPKRRRGKVGTSYGERIRKEPAPNKRSTETIRTILEPADPETRAYLLDLYSGKCQICGKTFPQRNGSPFFVAGHIVERKNARFLDNQANALSLCPHHFAQWRHGAVEAEDIIGQIQSKKTKVEGGGDDLSLKIVLCGNKCDISYKEKHIVDLQALIGALSNY